MGDYGGFSSARPGTAGRRGNNGNRPPSSSQFRPGSRAGALKGAVGYQGGGGSAVNLRLGTSMGSMGNINMPPGTSAGGPGRPGSALQGAHLKITDRPMTKEGLSGMKTGAQGRGRSVLDKTYYLGELRQKISQLQTEMASLGQELESYNRDNREYHSYEQRHEMLLSDVKELQGELGDYNTLIEHVNTDST